MSRLDPASQTLRAMLLASVTDVMKVLDSFSQILSRLGTVKHKYLSLQPCKGRSSFFLQRTEASLFG